jgi:phd_YefM
VSENLGVIMEIVSSREFRSQMGEFLKKARSSDIVIKSRSHGSFKIIPVTEDDTMMSKAEFFAKLDRAKTSIEAGHRHAMKPGETLEAFMGRMQLEGNV